MSAQRTIRNSSIWLAVISLGVALSVSCSEPLKNRVPLGERFPEVTGEALDKRMWRIPQEWAGEPTLALLGYVQDSQFSSLLIEPIYLPYDYIPHLRRV